MAFHDLATAKSHLIYWPMETRLCEPVSSADLACLCIAYVSCIALTPSTWCLGLSEAGAALRAGQTAFIRMPRERRTVFPFTQTPLWFFLGISISLSKWFFWVSSKSVVLTALIRSKWEQVPYFGVTLLWAAAFPCSGEAPPGVCWDQRANPDLAGG